MTFVDIKLPEHAIRYLARLCKRERQLLARGSELSLQSVAEFDSLEAIENALPSSIVGET